VFELQPRYNQDLEAAAPLLVGNLAEVVGRCGGAADRALKVGAAAAAAHLKELRGESRKPYVERVLARPCRYPHGPPARFRSGAWALGAAIGPRVPVQLRAACPGAACFSTGLVIA
jgi:hypothetical protein